jgi:AraC-like DNA-binding protein
VIKKKQVIMYRIADFNVAIIKEGMNKKNPGGQPGAYPWYDKILFPAFKIINTSITIFKTVQSSFMKNSDKAIATPEVFPFSVVRSIRQARDFMNNEIRQHLSIKELAKRSGTNEYCLKKGFKALYQVSVYQYLLLNRMEYASQLLKTTSLKEKEIAWCCGFETLSGFVTTFKKYYGTCPREQRKPFDTANAVTY